MKPNCRIGISRHGLFIMRAKPKTGEMMPRTMKCRREAAIHIPTLGIESTS
jgi:hypothetical protein